VVCTRPPLHPQVSTRDAPGRVVIALPAPPLVLDHLAYLTQRRHRREVHAAMLRAARRRTRSQVTVVHGEGCCRLEPWPVTFGKLLRALADDGARPMGVVA
jgi:hypothetical protein